MNPRISHGANTQGHMLGLSMVQRPRGRTLGSPVVQTPKGDCQQTPCTLQLDPWCPPRPHRTPAATLHQSNGTWFPSSSPGIPQDRAACLHIPGGTSQNSPGSWAWDVVLHRHNPVLAPLQILVACLSVCPSTGSPAGLSCARACCSSG